ncbi:MAG: head-tail adaptor protein [Alphaproteobacteria bacterium]|nr:MAG: head-tail adaptor protein [Alphaproteobacteria bacterium]
MRAPRLNRKLVLEGASRVSDGAGGYDLVWTALGTLWAEVKAGAGREAEMADITVGEARYRITVRAAPHGAPSRPVPGQRFREGGRLWRILAVTDADAQARYLICHAVEEVVA